MKSAIHAVGSTAKPHGLTECGAPAKYPKLWGEAQKTRGPWPKGGNFGGMK